jgi:hypothetical protein
VSHFVESQHTESAATDVESPAVVCSDCEPPQEAIKTEKNAIAKIALFIIIIINFLLYITTKHLCFKSEKIF